MLFFFYYYFTYKSHKKAKCLPLPVSPGVSVNSTWELMLAILHGVSFLFSSRMVRLTFDFEFRILTFPLNF